MLADEAGVAASTASAHLGKLVDGGLLTVESHGRHRYFALADARVGELIEALARLAPPAPVRSLRQGTNAQAAAHRPHLLRPPGRGARRRADERA